MIWDCVVSRVVGRGENYDMDIVLDVHSDLYKVAVGEKFSLVLAKTVNLDGTPDDGSYKMFDGPTLMDKYEYVMHGRVFRFQQDSNQPMTSSA